MSIEVRREERVAILTINRPEALNALSSALLEELRSELAAIAGDTTVGCLILTGAGDKAFIAGADIAEMATKTPLEARAYADLGHAGTDDRGRQRLCARWWLGDGAGLRHPALRGERRVRAA